MKKIYILDTNILIQTAGQAIHGFADNHVVITHTTLEELDGLKNAPGETGYNARECIRIIGKLNEQEGNYLDGINLDNNGTFRIETNHLEAELPVGWKIEKPDNRIICTAKSLAKESDIPVVLITNDVAMRIKAISAGVETQGYRNEQVDIANTYTGKKELMVPPIVINELYEKREMTYERFSFLCNNTFELEQNEFLLLTDDFNIKHTALAWYKKNEIKLINHKNGLKVCGISPKNISQQFALEALLAPAEDVPLVILKGPAGCGKTILAMAAGLSKTYDRQYHKKGKNNSSEFDKVIISRSNTLSDEDMGFLPGTLEEKMTPLLSPFFDNLEVLLRKGTDEEPEQIKMQMEDILETGIVEITSLAYVRGRSIPRSYMIIDEAQNITVSQAKTIITRAGMGTKVILCGDPEQIDNPKLDKRNNGLVFTSERMKGSSLCAQISFEHDECVRSPLSYEAAEKLNS